MQRLITLLLLFTATATFAQSYEKQWKTIDSLQQKALPESALKKVATLRAKAKADKNYVQWIKGTLHWLKFSEDIYDDSLVVNINNIRAIAPTLPEPSRQVLYSYLGEFFQQYHQANHWQFKDRTNVSVQTNPDFSTWDLLSLLNKADEYYTLSLSNSNSLKQTLIEKYQDILSNSSFTTGLYPTLFDLVANRNLNFYEFYNSSNPSASTRFNLNGVNWFSSADVFINLPISATDSTDGVYRAAKLYQSLLQFHQNDKDIAALADADLRRLDYFWNKQSQDKSAEKDYINALQKFIAKYQSNPISTEAAFKLASLYMNRNRAPLTWNYAEPNPQKEDLAQARKLCADAAKNFPESVGGTNCRNLLQQILQLTLSFKLEETNTCFAPFRMLLNYKNLDVNGGAVPMHFKICKLDKGNEQEWIQYNRSWNLIEKQLQAAALNTFNVSLPGETDLLSHSTEIAMPALPPGVYFLAACKSERFDADKSEIAYDAFWVSDIAVSNADLPGEEASVAVMNRQTGKPIAGAKVELFSNEYDYKTSKYKNRLLGTYTTDSKGLATVKGRSDQYNTSIHVQVGEDSYWSKNNIYFSKDENYDPTSRETFFFTDRAIYRPGQTVYFKGISVLKTKEKSSPVVGEKTRVELKDANYQDVASLELTTNEYGSFTGSFVLPTGKLNGTFQIVAPHGTVAFSVEEYKRPKYEVKFLPIKGTYKLGDEVVAVLEAKTYTGLPVGNAKVSYNITRGEVYRWYWSKHYGNNEQVVLANGNIVTDENGKAEIRFKATAADNAGKDTRFNFSVNADVSDANGESHSAETSINIGAKSFFLETNFPNQFDSDTLKTIQVLAKNSAGQAVQDVSGFVSIYKLSPPNHFFRNRMWERPDRFITDEAAYNRSFPYDIYDDETNREHFPKTLISKIAFNTSKDTILNVKGIFKSGQYYIKIEGIAKTDTVSMEVYAKAVSGTKPEVDKTELVSFRLINKETTPGGKLDFEIASSMEGTQVLMEVYVGDGNNNSQKIVRQEWLNLPYGFSRNSLKLEESWGENVEISFTGQRFNTLIHQELSPEISKPKDKFTFTVESFRNAMESGKKETWRLKVAGNDGEKLSAEILAGMYDASLDAFKPHSWNFNPLLQTYVNITGRNTSALSVSNSNVYTKIKRDYFTPKYKAYYTLNWFGFNPQGRGHYGRSDRMELGLMAMSATPTATGGAKRKTTESKEESKAMKSVMVAESDAAATESLAPQAETKNSDKDEDTRASSSKAPEFSPRKNLNETAFFFPQLKTDENGAVIVEFTAPEALTSWKFMALAHSKDLRFAQLVKEAVTRKNLMVAPNWPRFFREGDTLVLTSKINRTGISSPPSKGGVGGGLNTNSDISSPPFKGGVGGGLNTNSDNSSPPSKGGVGGGLIIKNPISGKDITSDFLISSAKPLISLNEKGEGLATWTLRIPKDISVVELTISASMGDYSDGEQMTIPVVTNRMLVTETLPMRIKGGESREFNFEKLSKSNSPTLSHQKLTVEYTSNPAWYAIQALPYLMDGEKECSEQIFNRYYANSIGTWVANSNPKIKAVFEQWGNAPALLERGLGELAATTPWLQEALNETEQKRNVARLFDTKKMDSELQEAIQKLKQLQSPNGGFVWFPSMPDDRYITQHIVEGFGHLQQLGLLKLEENADVQDMVSKALQYLNAKLVEDYNWLKKEKVNMEEVRVNDLQLHYLYALSYFPDQLSEGSSPPFKGGVGGGLNTNSDKVHDFYRKQMSKYWTENSIYGKGLVAMIAHRKGDAKLAADVVKSLKETAIKNPELGMYWKAANQGYWYQAPVETNSLMVEVFSEVGKDATAVDDLRTWLLTNKQTTNWKSSKATAEACYALLLGGKDWLTTESKVEIKIGNKTINPATDKDLKTEAGTGYFKKEYAKDEINKEMGKISVMQPNSSPLGSGASWGAVYWQYYENLDKISPAETQLKITKKLYVERNSDKGKQLLLLDAKTTLHKGDKLKVRIEIYTDRAMEYVHLKDMRAAGFEPVEALSGYRWQDGLGYYQSPKDLSTDFFISYLQKGTYVFEYPLWVQNSGEFSNGITTIQCMYAPEFTSHSEGVRVKVE